MIKSFTYLYNIHTVPHLAMYNVYFFAQIFEGKITMRIIHRYNDYMGVIMGIITLYIMHKGIWVCIICSKIWYALRFRDHSKHFINNVI